MIPGIICPRNTAHPTLTNVRAQLFQLFRDSWTAITAKAKTGLFLDVGQNPHVSALLLTGRSAVRGRAGHVR